jgi:hypothetical protein
MGQASVEEIVATSTGTHIVSTLDDVRAIRGSAAQRECPPRWSPTTCARCTALKHRFCTKKPALEEIALIVEPSDCKPGTLPKRTRFRFTDIIRVSQDELIRRSGKIVDEARLRQFDFLKTKVPL